MSTQTTVILLNFNGRKLLEKYLAQVINTCKNKARVVLADNGSSDTSIEYAESLMSKEDILQFDQNYGYAGGYNKAIEQIQAEKLILLNTDVFCPDDWLEPLIAGLDIYDACMPKILSDLEKSKFDYAGAAGGYMDALGYPFCRGRIFNEIETDNGQYNNDIEIFWASGACLAVRRASFIEAGAFDESLFAHQEEIDLCWRMQNRNMKIGFCHRSSVYHLGGGTLSVQSEKKTYLNFRNNLCIIFKNAQTSEAIQIISLRLLLDGIAGLQFLFKGKLYHMLAIVRAHFSFYGRIPSLIEARGQQPEKKKLRQLKGVYLKSILFHHYILQKKTFNRL
ncbi:MAG TPA: glycosyltransferase family 2 protein [Bacteroidia bacterium]|nr:glycosyltransferase family 2 protein [Bacteroidia bacterium]HNT80389.1 glycosyltransferase family 2 protein [Bacteroidia bacterium]